MTVLGKNLRPRARHNELTILVIMHPWGREESVSWRQAPIGLHVAEERIFKRKLMCCYWWRRSGEKAKTTDVYYSHHTYELILSMYSAEVFWRREYAVLVFSRIAMKTLLLLAIKKTESHLRGSNVGKKKLHLLLINLVIKIMKISWGKSHPPPHPSCTHFDSWLDLCFLNIDIFDLAEPQMITKRCKTTVFVCLFYFVWFSWWVKTN